MTDSHEELPATPPAAGAASRRGFLAAAGLLAVAPGEAPAQYRTTTYTAEPRVAPFPAGSTLLFQGDSITDAGRKKKQPKPNSGAGLGNGYAFLAASQLLTAWPQAKFTIHNRGISGNKVPQLAARWQQDCLDLKPDVVSILIGVNDIWHRLNGNYNGTPQTYRDEYRSLLERTKESLPGVKLVVCEPFVLRCGVIDERWFPEFDERRAAAKELADDLADVWVPFQSMFDKAVAVAPPEKWAGDGVHPSPAGAALMAGEWLRAVGA